jgi:NADH dehydrogenase [ubiquinone] 1 alpha subcomplex assembly factor 1
VSGREGPCSGPIEAWLLFDFRDAQAVGEWAPIDDRVMGGVSRSRLRHDAAGHAVFEGEVSLDRGGGFASVRSSARARGRAGATVCVIEVRGGSGRSYRLGFFTDDGFDSMAWQSTFHPTGHEWQILCLPLATFRASFRGRELPGAPPLDPARIRQIGLVLGQGQAGPFALDMRRIGLA